MGGVEVRNLTYRSYRSNSNLANFPRITQLCWHHRESNLVHLVWETRMQTTPINVPHIYLLCLSVQRFSRAGPRGRGREWATLGVHPLSWLLSNNLLEKVPVVSVPHTSSNRLLLSNQDKGCTPSVAHSLPFPLGPALLNLSTIK